MKKLLAALADEGKTDALVELVRGALDRLSRDELQGVIGHEFSHILNGDMRLNVRLLAVIAGIVVIGGMGRAMMEARRNDDDVTAASFDMLVPAIGACREAAN